MHHINKFIDGGTDVEDSMDYDAACMQGCCVLLYETMRVSAMYVDVRR